MMDGIIHLLKIETYLEMLHLVSANKIRIDYEISDADVHHTTHNDLGGDEQKMLTLLTSLKRDNPSRYEVYN